MWIILLGSLTFIFLILDTLSEDNRAQDNWVFLPQTYIFKNNLHLFTIEFIACLLINFIPISNFRSLIVIVAYSVSFFHVVTKAKNLGGYTNRLFDIVEAFGFMSILANTFKSFIIYSFFILIGIVLAAKIDKDKDSCIFNLLALFEVWILYPIGQSLGNSFYGLICCLLLPYSFFKALNLIIIKIYNHFH